MISGGSGTPHIDDTDLARALRAVGEDGDVNPNEGYWLTLSPGLDPLKLALAVVSEDFAQYLQAQPLSAAERKAVAGIRALSQETALAEISRGRWDPPYGDPR